MLKQPKVSIIIPVYNTEKYINKCLDSLIYQTYENLEILCIDDGSTDNSLEILEQYAKKDSRIKILTQENKGQSTARNNGMAHATGDYISFVDSDDWVSLSLYKKFADAYNSTDGEVEIYMFNAVRYDEKPDLKNYIPAKVLNIKIWEIKPDKLLYNANDSTNPIDGNTGVWSKIYKKSFLDERNIKFEDGIIFEDKVFHFDTFFNSDKIFVSNDALYFYRYRASSTMNTMGSNVFDVFKANDMMLSILHESGMYEKNKYAYFQFSYKHFLYLLGMANIDNKREFYERSKQELRKMVEGELLPQIYNRLHGIQLFHEFMNMSYDEFYEKRVKYVKHE